MDLLARMDPEVGAGYPHLPVLDLDEIPTARSTMMDMLAAATAGLPASDNVLHEDHRAPGLNGDPDVRVRHYRPADQTDTLPCTRSAARPCRWSGARLRTRSRRR